MITFILLATQLALASTSDPGLAHPDAAPTPGGEVTVSMGLGTLAVVDFHSDRTDLTLEPAAELHGSWAITNGLRIDAAAGGTPGGFGKFEKQQIDPFLHLGARWVVARPGGIGIAPFADVTKTSVNSGFASAGVALEGGGERLRFDAALPLMVRTDTASRSGDVHLYGPLMALATTGELGLSWHATDHHGLRLGLISIMPNLSWCWAGGSWFGDVTVATLPVSIDPLQVLAGAHVGRKF